MKNDSVVERADALLTWRQKDFRTMSSWTLPSYNKPNHKKFRER